MNFTQREWDRVVGIGNPPEEVLLKPIKTTNEQDDVVKIDDDEAELLKKLRVIRKT